MPIENFIGPVDIFITSDWTEPPTKKAKKATILYDLIVYKYPDETHKKIVAIDPPSPVDTTNIKIENISKILETF